MKPPTIRLTEDQIESYRRDGWLRIDSMIPAEEAAEISRLLDRVADERRETGLEPPRRGQLRASMIQILNPVYDAIELIDTQVRANATAAARQLIGAAAEFCGEQAMIKPPFHPVPTGWHQDQSYWEEHLDYEVMTFWIPLQNTNEQNGCMRFLSASHRQDVVEHRLVDPTVEMPDFEVADPTCIDPARVHIVPLPLGSATVHSCRTLHSAFCNRSPSPRKAYTMGFGFKPTVRPHRRRFTWNPRMYPLESVSP